VPINPTISPDLLPSPRWLSESVLDWALAVQNVAAAKADKMSFFMSKNCLSELSMSLSHLCIAIMWGRLSTQA